MESVVEYEVVKFHRGFGHDIPIYEMPPSAEVDKAWKDLYQDCMSTTLFVSEVSLTMTFILDLASKATRAEAEQMVNKTILIQDKSGYMVGIDVFHQLHCLVRFYFIVKINSYFIQGHDAQTPPS
jgi:hypothetical protein